VTSATARPAAQRIRALLPIEADGRRIEPGQTAELRAELAAELIALGAAEDAPARGKGG
jgi:hypothetical protein